MSIQQMLLGGSPSGYLMDKSLRFRASASAYLSRSAYPVASAGTKWTLSMWVKRGSLGIVNLFSFVATSGAAQQAGMMFDSNNNIRWWQYAPSTYQFHKITTAVFRDPSAWYHLVFVYDTTLATAEDRCQVWVNGVRQTAFSTNINPSLNLVTYYKTGQLYPYIGAENRNNTYLNGFDGYLADTYFVDGQALTPSSFGETNALTGVWQPAPYTGTYGTNGFYLDFEDTSSVAALGTDSSGNGNTWTVNNISLTAGVTYDSMTDVPTLTSATAANYAVFNPIVAPAFLQGAVISNGNLRVIGTNGVANTFARSTMGISGKMYAEFFFDIVSSTASIGVAPVNDTASTGNLAAQSTNICYRSGGNKRVLGTETAYGASWAANNIIGVAVDTSANTVEFFKNGVSQGVITSSAFFAQGDCLFAISTDDVGSPIGYANFGQRPFAYTPPTGFVALNTFNLPTATILKGNTVMDATLYTGNGSTQTITNAAGFQPDFVWLKCRNSAGTSHRLWDSVRGATKGLSSNLTDAEYTESGLTAFNTNGFSLGSQVGSNGSGNTYVGWQWQAGQGTTSSNTDGSITSTVSVNPTAGFSVVTYTGNASVASFGHGLGVAPKMIIIKNRTASGAGSNWCVGIDIAGWTWSSDYLYLNSTIAKATDGGTTQFYSAPTSTVVNIGGGTNTNGNTNSMVAYCWAEIAGYSAFGSYTGNGSTDGPFVYLGFEPKFILAKRTNTTGNWNLLDGTRDPYNAVGSYLYANTADAEGANASTLDFTANGFKIRQTYGDWNVSGSTYLYACFAENPFKNSLAR